MLAFGAAPANVPLKSLKSSSLPRTAKTAPTSRSLTHRLPTDPPWPRRRTLARHGALVRAEVHVDGAVDLHGRVLSNLAQYSDGASPDDRTELFDECGVDLGPRKPWRTTLTTAAGAGRRPSRERRPSGRRPCGLCLSSGPCRAKTSLVTYPSLSLVEALTVGTTRVDTTL